MNPDQNAPDPKLQTVSNPLSVMRDGEQVLCEIKRHPIGIMGIYFMAGVIVLGALGAAAFVPAHDPSLTSQNKAALLFGVLLVVVIALLYTYVARIVYKGNRWILTDDSLTQVTQDGLFRKHSSQLSLANLEDVTADQNGMLQAMFGFGILKAETAGERSKFIFLYCPKPNDYARQILAARERFIMNEPDAAKRANDKLGTPGMASNFTPPPMPQQQPYYGNPPAAAPALSPQTPPQPYDPTQPAPYPPQDPASQTPADPTQPQ